MCIRDRRKPGFSKRVVGSVLNEDDGPILLHDDRLEAEHLVRGDFGMAVGCKLVQRGLHRRGGGAWPDALKSRRARLGARYRNGLHRVLWGDLFEQFLQSRRLLELVHASFLDNVTRGCPDWAAILGTPGC